MIIRLILTTALFLALAPAVAYACDVPNKDVMVLRPAQPTFTDMPHFTRKATAIVDVTVGPDGKAKKFRLTQTSGNTAVDHAALLAAEESTYTPKVVNCKPAAGQFSFVVTFNPAPR